MSNGAVFPGVSADKVVLLEYEKIVLNTQLFLENTFLELASNMNEMCVLIIDRGTLDIAAYLREGLWDELLLSLHIDSESLLSRYDMICHLVTAADGAAQHYGGYNNNVRTETAEEAIALDRRCQQCWKGHSNLHVIDNSTDFEGKLSRAVEAITEDAGAFFRDQS